MIRRRQGRMIIRINIGRGRRYHHTKIPTLEEAILKCLLYGLNHIEVIMLLYGHLSL